MRVGGRVGPAAVGPIVACLCACVHYTTSKQHGIPIQIKVWDTGRSPLSHMVDVTNSFGLKVLAEHNFLNNNNIAFSPYGLMGILVALYEGVDGESSFEIQRTLQLPWNRNIMRVGFRDIHRTLKTYFVPEEGFLAGLALNNENVTFNKGYKNILRFYGFDLDNEQLPTLPPTAETNATTTSAPEMPTETTTISLSSSMPSKEDTTPNPDAETISTILSSTTVNPSSAANAEITTTMPSTAEQATVQSIITETTTMAATTLQQTIQTPVQETTTTPEQTTTTKPDTTSATVTVMTTKAETLASTTTSDVEIIDSTLSPTPTAALTEETIDNNIVEGLTTSTDLSTTLETSTSTIITSTETAATTTQSNPTTIKPSNIETLQRKKKSIVDFIYTNPPYLDDFLVYRSYNVPIQNPLFDNTMFLSNGLKYVQVSYMHYNAVLGHAYLPHLEACALKLPLDSDRYYLLVILPDRAGIAEIGRLLSRMARESDLSDVYASLRPRNVRAIVPSFMVKGHVILTTDLQKLGIRNVFEPRQFDFTPMTRQPGVYVRSVEQAVSVAITKYQPDDYNKNRYVSNRPVSFSATYPFLYFVMDSTINVAIMAGKMVDPLNSRVL